MRPDSITAPRYPANTPIELAPGAFKPVAILLEEGCLRVKIGWDQLGLLMEFYRNLYAVEQKSKTGAHWLCKSSYTASVQNNLPIRNSD